MTDRLQVRTRMLTIQLDKIPQEDWYLKVPQWEKFPKIALASGQIEIGEKNKKPHWQIFIKAVDRITLRELFDMGLQGSQDPLEGHYLCPKRKKWIKMNENKALNYVRKDTIYPESRFTYPADTQCFVNAKRHWERVDEYDAIFEGIVLDKNGKIDPRHPNNKKRIIKLLQLNLEGVNGRSPDNGVSIW